MSSSLDNLDIIHNKHSFNPKRLTKHNESIDIYISNVKKILNSQFTNILTTLPAPCPILQQALEYTMLANGKNLRAALIFATCPKIYNNILSKLNNKSLAKLDNSSLILLNSACAIELIHTYSIIHDDLPSMDDDDFRRGKPSCHKKFNEATAILVGDCLQTLAFTLLADRIVEPVNQLKIIQILSNAIGHQGMVAGQSLELNQDNSSNFTNNNLQINKLNQIHNLKTGKLFTACVEIGAVINNIEQDTNQFQLLSSLGKNIGLAFQIQDDILDYTKSSSELGKPAKSDTKRNLPTYSNIIGLNEAENILDELWQECNVILHQLNLDTSILEKLINFIKLRQC